MAIQSITVRISDGIKTVDYAPPRLYDLTAVIIDPRGADAQKEVLDAISILKAAGESFLGRSAPASAVTVTASEPAAEVKPRAAKAAAQKANKEAAKPTVAPSGGADELEDDLGETEPGDEDFDAPIEADAKPVTDAELNDAAQAANRRVGDPKAIREIINSYNDDPTKVFQMRQIPAAKRAEFIAKLEGLKKA